MYLHVSDMCAHFKCFIGKFMDMTTNQFNIISIVYGILDFVPKEQSQSMRYNVILHCILILSLPEPISPIIIMWKKGKGRPKAVLNSISRMHTQVYHHEYAYAFQFCPFSLAEGSLPTAGTVVVIVEGYEAVN